MTFNPQLLLPLALVATAATATTFSPAQAQTMPMSQVPYVPTLQGKSPELQKLLKTLPQRDYLSQRVPDFNANLNAAFNASQGNSR